MKRLAVFLLAIALLVSFMAGCSGNQGTTDTGSTDTGSSTTDKSSSSDTGSSGAIQISAKGVLPITNEKLEITAFMAQSATVEDYETNKYTKFLEEQTNIHVNWQLVPSKDKDQKLNLILASGEQLPDVFLGGVGNEILVDYASQGIFLPLSDYIDSQSAYFVNILAEYDGLEEMLTAPDGKIYGLPNITKSVPNSYPRRMWINQKWLDTLGLDMPETTQEMKEVLTAFKTQDPNQNGKQDEIPMMGATNGWHTTFDRFLMNSFIQYNNNSPYYVVDGKITPVYDKEAYRNGLRYMKSLVDEGLYDPVSFTQDASQLKQQFENEECAIIGAVPGGGPNSFANMSGTRYKEYTAVPPLEGPDGVRLANHEPYSYIMVGNNLVITKDCKYPEAIFKWGDYMYDHDVSMRSRLGEPGVDWLEPPAGSVDLAGDPALYVPVLLWGNLQNSHWMNANPTHENFADKLVRSDDPYELQRYLWEATYNSYVPYTPPTGSFIPKMLYSAEDSKRLSEINTILNSFINESRDKFIVGAMDIDNGWDQYLEELKKIGYEEVVSIMQNRYDELKK